MSRLLLRATSALTALTIFTSQLPALAQAKPDQIDSGLSPERGSEEAVEQARKLVEEGDALMKKSKYADGTAKFRAAWGLHATYFTACKAGRGEAQLEHFPEAASFLAYCLKHFTLSDDPKQKAAEKKYRGLQTDVLKKVGRVEVDLAPKHAGLSVDGTLLDEELFEGDVFVSPGEHKFEASASGFVSASQVVNVAAGESAQTTLKLEVEKSATAPASPPLASAPSSPPPDAATEQPADEGGSMMTRNIVVIAGGVLALGALTGSFIFRGEANAKADDADALRKGLPSNACQGGGGGPVCAELDGLQSDRESAASTSNILLGAGIGLAVASVAAFFLWPKPKQQAALGEPPPVGLRGVDVFVEPDRAALGFRGAF